MKNKFKLVDSSLLFVLFCSEASNSGQILEFVSGEQTKPESIFIWSETTMAAKVVQKGTKSLDSEDNGDMDEKLLKKTASFASRYYRRRSLKTERKQDKVLIPRGPFTGQGRFVALSATTDSLLHNTFPQQVDEQQASTYE